MRLCSQCGYPNPDSLKECFKCQTPLEQPEHQAQQDGTSPDAMSRQAKTDVGRCTNCGAASGEVGYELILCADCRAKLVNRPLPAWVLASAAVILLIVVYASFRFPSMLAAGVAFDKGQRAEAAADFALAESEYQKVAFSFPDSTIVLARLAIAQCRGRDLSAATPALLKLEGRKVSSKLARELESAVREAQQQPLQTDRRR